MTIRSPHLAETLTGTTGDPGARPARTDVDPERLQRSAAPRRPGSGWALAGLISGVAGIGAIAASMAVSAVYDPALGGDPEKINEALGEMAPQILTFHVLGMVSAVLMIVFAAGLLRRLRAGTGPDSLVPTIATAGVFGTALVMVIGTALDTEFVFGAGTDEVVPESAVFFNHWIGTVPWCWGLLGLAGVALFAAARHGDLPRWIGLVGLLGGGLTLLLGISPLQYMAGMTGPVGLVVIALGFLLGDRAHRAAG